MLSCPVALTKRKYEPAWGWLRIVAGPRLYTFQFYSTNKAAALGSPVVHVMEARSGSSVFSEWKQHLETAAKITPDTAPIIAATTPPSLKKAASAAIMGLYLFFAVLMIIGFVGGFMIGDTSSGNTAAPSSNRLMQILNFGLAAAAFTGLILLNKRRKRRDSQALDATELTPQSSDIFTAGTPPTASFGMTVGKQVLLGILTIPAVFIIITIVMSIANPN